MQLCGGGGSHPQAELFKGRLVANQADMVKVRNVHGGLMVRPFSLKVSTCPRGHVS